MIGRLRGTLAAKQEDRVVLDVGGIGYEVAVTPRALADLPGIGEEVVLHTHLHVREDQLGLFGFTTEDRRDLFRLLIGLSGIGPKVGLAILSTMEPEELRRVVAAEDAGALTTVPGIGKRTAQKLLIELQARLDVLEVGATGAGGAPSDVREALTGLGYGADEIREAMRELPVDLPVEELLRLSLQELGKLGRS